MLKLLNVPVNIVVIAFMLIFSFILNWYVNSAIDARDDSQVVWEDVCNVSPELTDKGNVWVQCDDDEQTIIWSHYGPYAALVGNTPIEARQDISVSCRLYQSGRWTCQIGQEGGHARFNLFSS